MDLSWLAGGQFARSAQYTGEKVGGELAYWKYFNADPNYFLTLTYGRIVDYSATLYNTSSVARACVEKPLAYVVGDGLRFQSHIDNEFLGMTKQAAVEWSKRFTNLLNYAKLSINYYEKMAQIYREMCISGDCLVYLLREEGSEAPLDVIPTAAHEIAWEHTDDKGFLLGIKRDRFNRPVGFQQQKDKKKYISFYDYEKNQRNAVLCVGNLRPGQVRGYPSYFTEISRLKNLDRWWDAILERVVQEAVHIGVWKLTDTDVALQARRMGENRVRAEHGVENDIGGINKVASPTVPGFYELNNKEGLEFTDQKTPSDTFGLANDWTLRMVSMATGWSSEFVRGEYSTSFTAHKGALNDTWKRILLERQSMIKFDKMVNEEFLKYFVLSGKIKVPADITDSWTMQAFLGGNYAGPELGHINPLQEVKADIEAINAGLKLPSDVSKKYGNDFGKSLDDWGKELSAIEQIKNSINNPASEL